MKEEFVQNSIVRWLNKEGWIVMKLATTSEKGGGYQSET